MRQVAGVRPPHVLPEMSPGRVQRGKGTVFESNKIDPFYEAGSVGWLPLLKLDSYVFLQELPYTWPSMFSRWK